MLAELPNKTETTVARNTKRPITPLPKMIVCLISACDSNSHSQISDGPVGAHSTYRHPFGRSFAASCAAACLFFFITYHLVARQPMMPTPAPAMSKPPAFW